VPGWRQELSTGLVASFTVVNKDRSANRGDSYGLPVGREHQGRMLTAFLYSVIM
jgi:hypothetical protein